MSAIQIQCCAARIRDPAERDRFQRMMKRADELIAEAVKLRLQAWTDYRRTTGAVKREKIGQYARNRPAWY